MKLINCYEGFKEVYDDKFNSQELLDVWFNFMGKYKSIRTLCIEDYQEKNLNWREIVLLRVFNYDKEFVSKMNKTTLQIEEIVKSMEQRLKEFFHFKNEETYVIIYHGLGNGAGWVTKYNGIPAIYLGLEKIVELGWNSKNKLEDLISHEYGHLVHMKIRNESLNPYTDFKKKMIYRIYTEGVATYCEKVFNGRELSSPKWYKEAKNKEELLKKEFIKRLNNNAKDCQDFFGDWNPVFGINEAGYFLGLKIIDYLTTKMSLIDVMKLEYDIIEKVVVNYLNFKDNEEMLF